MSTQYFELKKDHEYIKIYGLQRSGTNYLTHLINENLEKTQVLVNLGGWKHGHYAAPWMVGKEVHVLLITKNPYSWLVSVYNYWGVNRKINVGPDLRGVSFEDFLKNKLYLEKQRDIPYLFRSSNPIQHWNNMNFHWMTVRLNQKKLLHVSYEELIEEPEATVKSVAENYDLKIKNEIKNEEKIFTPSGETPKTGEEKFNKDFYSQNQFMNMYTPELIEYVNEQLDLDVVLRLGYFFVEPESLKQ